MHTSKRNKPATVILDKITPRAIYDAALAVVRHGEPLTLEAVRRHLRAPPGLISRLTNPELPLRAAYEAAKWGRPCPTVAKPAKKK